MKNILTGVIVAVLLMGTTCVFAEQTEGVSEQLSSPPLLLASSGIKVAATGEKTSAPPVSVAQAGIDITKSASGGNILNPLPGEETTDRQPMIGVKLPETPAIKPESIKIFLDGNDVTGETQVSIEYIFYLPATPLKYGVHNVRVTYNDVNDNPLPPVSWDFSVVMAVREIPKVRPVRPVVKEPSVSTSGKMTIEIGDVYLNNAKRANNWPSTDIKYKESERLLNIFDFTHKFYGNTIIGHFDRTIEEITGRPNDRGYLNFINTTHNITLGDYTTSADEYSEYSISGVRMRGIKAMQQTPIFHITSLFGRSQEPQDGRFKRTTYGAKLAYNLTNSFKTKLILLRSREEGIASSSSLPANDNLMSLVNNFTYNKRLSLFSEIATDKRSVLNVNAATIAGKDSAAKFYLNYKVNPIALTVGRRSVGPNFNPTTLGTFIEKDREGSYASFTYAPSKIWTITTFYDDYHNNLHHQRPYDYTDDTANSISSLTYRSTKIPNSSYRYSKLYTLTDAQTGFPGTTRNESTSENLTFSYNLPDLKTLVGSRFMMVLSRYDIDRFTNTGTAVLFSMRSDTSNYTISTRYKSKAVFSYNNTHNDTITDTVSASTTLTESESTTDGYALQLNVVPFKFITNFDFRRSVRSTITTTAAGSSLTGNTIEWSKGLTMVYYVTQKSKLNFSYIDFDRQYRAAINAGRSYDERLASLSYSFEF
ncbi:MAG: hypothetical protein AB1546_13720 [bacterium]